MSAHDRPTAAELIESVREWLERDVLSSVEGRLSFHTRVAINSLDIVIRELKSQDEFNEVHAGVLRKLLADSDADLSLRIRAGEFDNNLLDLLEELAPVVENKVRVSNPKYMQ